MEHHINLEQYDTYFFLEPVVSFDIKIFMKEYLYQESDNSGETRKICCSPFPFPFCLSFPCHIYVSRSLKKHTLILGSLLYFVYGASLFYLFSHFFHPSVLSASPKVVNTCRAKKTSATPIMKLCAHLWAKQIRLRKGLLFNILKYLLLIKYNCHGCGANKVLFGRGVVLVGLLVRRRDHVARKFMGHDLKQFKSLEVIGFCYHWLQ